MTWGEFRLSEEPADRRRTPEALSGSLLNAVVMLETMGYGAVFTMLAALQRRYDLPTWGVGALTGVTFLSSVGAQLGLARYADRGHAVSLLRLGLFASAVGLFAFAAGTQLWEFILARTVTGLGVGMFLPARTTVALAGSQDDSGGTLGRLMALSAAGFMLGPGVAGAISSVAGLKAPFILLGTLLAVSVAATAYIREPDGSPEQGTASNLRQLLAVPGTRAALYITAGGFVIAGMFDGCWSIFLRDHGAGTLTIALSFTAFGVPLVLLAPRGGRLADRVGPMRVARYALVCVAGVALLYGIVEPVVLLVLASLLQGTVESALIPATQASMARAAPPGMLATGQGSAGAVGAGVSGTASAVGATIYGAFGAQATWAFGAATCICFLLLSVRAQR
jgi:MFS family permease